MKKNTHEFSIHISNVEDLLGQIVVGHSVVIRDTSIIHRIANVLRLTPQETVILFDHKQYVRVQIERISKKEIAVVIEEINQNIALSPEVIFLLPLLKRDALENAIYSLVELGATTIQLVQTQKVQRAWGGKKELDRLHKIMIAAAEQSKQYRMAILSEPKSLAECIASFDESMHKLFFDPEGADLFETVSSLRNEKAKHIALLVGPEGDLTDQEKELVKNNGFIFCRLTPTILRAQQAVAVSLGVIRSLI